MTTVYRHEPLQLRWERRAQEVRAFGESLPARIGRALTFDEKCSVENIAQGYETCARELREAQERGER